MIAWFGVQEKFDNFVRGLGHPWSPTVNILSLFFYAIALAGFVFGAMFGDRNLMFSSFVYLFLSPAAAVFLTGYMMGSHARSNRELVTLQELLCPAFEGLRFLRLSSPITITCGLVAMFLT